MKGGAIQASAPFSLAAALGQLRKPAPPNEGPIAQWSKEEKRVWTEAKRQYSDNLSREITKAVELSLRTHFPKTHSGEGVGTNAASAQGIKSIDVAFNIEGLFLGLGVSIKTVGLPEEDRGYGHNFKRVTEEWTTETVLYHRYMPVSIIVGMLFLPADAAADRSRASSLNHAVEKFRGFQGRTSIRDDFELLEKIYVGLYEDSGEVRFVDVAQHLKPLETPAGTKVSSFEQIKDDLVRLFRQRNPKLRVKGMPEVDDSGAVTAASPALDEAFSDD
jgi:hypothetical protein